MNFPRLIFLLYVQFLSYYVGSTLALSPFFDAKGSPIVYDPRCSKNFTKSGSGSENSITSLNYPYNYEAYLNCGWLIETLDDAADIIIIFNKFHLESGKVCTKYDFVMVYKQDRLDGPWKKVGHEEGYCGDQIPFTLQAISTKKVFVQFVTDISREFQGFNATFEMHLTQGFPEVSCIKREELDSCNGTLINADTISPVMLTCKARGMPPPTFTWLKVINKTYAGQLDERIVKILYQNGSIVLDHLLHSDGGKYRCVAGNKYGSTQKDFELFVQAKCDCPEYLRVSWYPKPPYTKYLSKNVNKGILLEVMDKMIHTVCGKCKNAHNSTKVIWQDYSSTGYRSPNDVKDDIENDMADIYLPIQGYATDVTFRGNPFLPILENPGVALIILDAPSDAAIDGLFDSIIEAWPLFALIVILALIAGIIMWLLDSAWNEEEFPPNFSKGIIEGFWWAYITMTTVGYGDIAPRGVPGRIFAVIWILTGLVIIAIFTGVITAGLTATALNSDIKLYGAKFGAMNNTAEYRFGLVKNADMKAFESYHDLAADLEAQVIEGALLDAYTAAYYKSQFQRFSISKIIKVEKSYGVVFGEHLHSDSMITAFQNYLQVFSSNITKIVENNADNLGSSDKSAAEEATGDLFKPDNPLFVNSVTALSGMLFFAIIFGLMFEFLYLRPKQKLIEKAKNLDLDCDERVKESARQAKILCKDLAYILDDFYENWGTTLHALVKKHKEEQRLLQKKGKSSGPLNTAKTNPAFKEEFPEITEKENELNIEVIHVKEYSPKNENSIDIGKM